MRSYTYKFTGTETIRAASEAQARRELMLDLPHGAAVELIAESDGAPTEMPELRRIETVLSPAPVPQPRPVMTAAEHNAFPKGRWS
jgi:hypothetical protein